jgi:hypothetical protein
MPLFARTPHRLARLAVESKGQASLDSRSNPRGKPRARIASNCVHSLHTPILSCRSSPPYAAVLEAPRVMLSLLRRRLPPRPAAIVLSGLLPFLPVRYRRLVAVTSSPKAETIQDIRIQHTAPRASFASPSWEGGRGQRSSNSCSKAENRVKERGNVNSLMEFPIAYRPEPGCQVCAVERCRGRSRVRRHTHVRYPVADSNVTLPRAPNLDYLPSGASTPSLAAVENPRCVTLVTCYIEFCKLFPSIYG